MPRRSKIALVTSRAYGRMYPNNVKLVQRRLKAWTKKHRKEIINTFYRLAKPTFKSKKAVIVKASFDQDWIDAVLSDLKGEIELSPVMVTLVTESAEAVLKAMGEELSLFDSAAVGEAWMKEHGLELAKTVAESLKPVLLEAMSEGIALGEGPMKIKERIREALSGWEEYRLNRLARTEAMNAANEGAYQSILASEVFTHKEWIAHGGACKICAGQDGDVIKKEDTFSEGEYRPPQHPNCRCTIGAHVGYGKKTKPSPGVG